MSVATRLIVRGTGQENVMTSTIRSSLDKGIVLGVLIRRKNENDLCLPLTCFMSHLELYCLEIITSRTVGHDMKVICEFVDQVEFSPSDMGYRTRDN